jgi:hypothetical protein
LKCIYDDAIACAFVTDVYVEDDLSEATINNGCEFEVGDSVKYNSGHGNVHSAKYLRCESTDHGVRHRIVLADGQEIWTSASNLSLMDQTSLTDIPFDVESYCGEVGKGLSDEQKQIALMARPKKLTPLQQELMMVMRSCTIFHFTD